MVQQDTDQNNALFSIVSETADFIVINKHCDVDFHKGKNEASLCSHVRNLSGYQELYPVHRLDTMTSGLLVFAKRKDIAKQLAIQFASHTIEKYYCALAGTHPKKKQGAIIGDMYRSRNGTWALSYEKTNPAVTRFFSTGLGNGLRLYILRPQTGRTHQIRVAMKSLGVPIFGDPLYSSKNEFTMQSDRGYLHAFALRFTLNNQLHTFVKMPDSGKWFTQESTRSIIEYYREPWNLPWPGQNKKV